MFVTLDSAPAIVRTIDSSIIYDVALLVNAVYQQNIEPTQAGYIPKRIANKLRPQLKGVGRYSYDGSDEYTDMLYVLMADIGIVQLTQSPFSDTKARLEPGSQLSAWGKLDLPKQVWAMLEVWQQDNHWIDIVGVDYNTWSVTSLNQSSAYFSSYYRDELKGRETLLKYLAMCEPDQWYSVESLLDQIRAGDPFALRRGSVSYMTKREQKKLAEDRDEWLGLDGQSYWGMLSSTLYELGLVILGYDRPTVEAEEIARTGEDEIEYTARHHNPSSFMLTDLAIGVFVFRNQLQKAQDQLQKEQKGQKKYFGAEKTVLLKDAAAIAADRQRRSLIVQPSFELLLLEPDLPTLYRLLPFTQVGQLGLASTLKLTSAALLRGLAAGQKIEQIITTLSELSQKELPQNVIYTLNDWAKQYKEVRVTQALLIDVPNDSLTQDLLNSGKLQSFGLRQIAPGLLAVNGDVSLQELNSTFNKAGVAVHLGGNFNPKHVTR